MDGGGGPVVRVIVETPGGAVRELRISYRAWINPDGVTASDLCLAITGAFVDAQRERLRAGEPAPRGQGG